MYKKLLAACAALTLAIPGYARVESGTKPLIELIGNAGIAVRYNTDECDSGEYLGLYVHNGMKRAFILCPGETVDATVHMVVRHEAIHAIQHCINVARGTPVTTPVIEDDVELMEFVRAHLNEAMIAEIRRLYPRDQWRIEYEAFAGMHAYTSTELAELFVKACIYTDA